MAPTAFALPPEAKTYIANIRDRCHDLINSRIWTGLQDNEINIWLNNFSGEEEQYFAACILDSLIYRTSAQTKALAIHLLNRSLSNLTRVHPTPEGVIYDWRERLQKKIEPKMRLVTAISEKDNTTKSGYQVSRLMRQDLGVHEDWIIKPLDIAECIRNGIGIFVFIDDLLGTGTQFTDMCNTENLMPLIANHYVVYAPLVAHKKGIDHLNKVLPSLHVVAAEYLDDNSSTFNTCFNDNINSPDLARAFYDQMLLSRNLQIPNAENKYGFGNLELAYIFEHGTPDNSLHILWDKQPNWNPLYKR